MTIAEARSGGGLGAVVAAVSTTTFGALPVFLLGGFAVLVRDDLGFSQARLGVAVAVFFATAALGSTPAGLVADRFGNQRSLTGGLATSLVATVLAASARTWWQLTLALALAGLGHAALQVGANRLLAVAVPSRRQGLAFGIKQAAVPIATLLAGLALPAVGVAVGWRWAYVGVAAAAVVALAAQHRRRHTTEDLPVLGTNGRFTVPRRDLIVLSVAVGFGAGAANALGAFLVDFAAGAGMDLGRAGLLLAMASVVGLITRVGMGWLVDVLELPDLAVVASMLLAGALALAALPVVAPDSALIWVAAALAFGGGWGWPGLVVFIVARENPDAPAAATGVTQSGVFTGAVIGPLLFGLVATTVSYEMAWWGGAAAQVISAGMVIMVRQSLRRVVATAPAA